MSDKNKLLKTRIKKLNDSENSNGKCVIYVMSRDQRLQDNHALIAAQKHAIAKELPFAVVFCLYDKVAGRAREQYQFMIEGLYDVESRLNKVNIPFMMLFGDPEEKIGNVIHHTDPDAIYFDFSPLNGPKKLRDTLSSTYAVPMYVVDTHNMIPVWVVSDKKEVGARTIRNKIHRNFSEYLEVPEDVVSHQIAWPGSIKSMSDLTSQIAEVLDKQKNNGSILNFEPGEKAALNHLDSFVQNNLEDYSESRNDPSDNALSGMSPYLHFGHISSLRVAIKMRQVANGTGADLHLIHSGKMPQAEEAASKKVGSANALLEEMIVRKELSDNFCYYENDHKSVSSADDWAKKTIDAHDNDPREHIYSYEELEAANTHDSAWNAAQKQMMRTGKMHGYMRMYWAKKIKEWTGDAKTAVSFAIRLNDFYSIDGGDPNGYVGILWSIIGVHDRAWTEREVFGKVRYMNYGGLKRKFNIEAYEKQWND